MTRKPRRQLLTAGRAIAAEGGVQARFIAPCPVLDTSTGVPPGSLADALMASAWAMSASVVPGTWRTGGSTRSLTVKSAPCEQLVYEGGSENAARRLPGRCRGGPVPVV